MYKQSSKDSRRERDKGADLSREYGQSWLYLEREKSREDLFDTKSRTVTAFDVAQ